MTERHICELGVTQFVVGHYGGFDRLAAEAVMEAKAKHDGIELVLPLPHYPAERPIYKPAGFDYTYYPFGTEMEKGLTRHAPASHFVNRPAPCAHTRAED